MKQRDVDALKDAFKTPNPPLDDIYFRYYDKYRRLFAASNHLPAYI